ncbi:MAG: hypothetical protein ACD_75C02162G0005 [uncultured bacterium]|nr:MAG: hypothetical protein ACD_75C02162G0005 [uncultured bacterium]
MEGAALVVDVFPVGSGAEGGNSGPELFEDVGGDAIGGAIGAIEDYMEVIQGIVFGEGVFLEHDIPSFGIVDSRRLPHLIGDRSERRHFL